jgi:hypothetical protein
MRSFITVFLTLLLIFVISCASRALNQKETDPWAWLNTISGGKTAEIDITGKWRDAGGGWFGWGEGYLRQEQNKIRGAIGDYNIIGIVSGKIVYLVFLYAGKVYYTARLEIFQDSLTGNYFKAKDKEQTKGYATSFVRIVDPTKK